MDRQCEVEGCERRHFGRGYCKGHHSQWRKYGYIRSATLGAHCLNKTVTFRKLGADRRAGIRSKNEWKACIVAGTYDGPKALIRDLAAALDEDGLVSFTARKAMRRAATYIVDEEA